MGAPCGMGGSVAAAGNQDAMARGVLVRCGDTAERSEPDGGLDSRGVIWVHIGGTLTEIVVGFVIGSILAWRSGFCWATRYTVGSARALLMACYGIPRIALAPILIILGATGLGGA